MPCLSNSEQLDNAAKSCAASLAAVRICVGVCTKCENAPYTATFIINSTSEASPYCRYCSTDNYTAVSAIVKRIKTTKDKNFL